MSVPVSLMKFAKKSKFHEACYNLPMGNWRKIRGYTKNDLFVDLRGKLFTLEDLVSKGEEKYNLKENTCKKKLKRGIKEGLVAKRGKDHYQVIM